VNQQQQYANAARAAAGGIGDQPGAPPYPLYGVDGLGQVAETPVPFYRQPMFVFPAGVAVGLGLGYLVWGLALPRIRRNERKRIAKGDTET
jgi:hypothetical protein